MQSDINFKSAVQVILGFVVIFCFIPVALILVVDPIHLFHKPLAQLPWHKFGGDGRVEFAGMINTYLADRSEGYDSILVGSSASESMSAEFLTKKTEWKRVMKLTMLGGDAVAQKFLVDRALDTGNVHHIFWEVFSYKYEFMNRESFEKFQNSFSLDAFRKDDIAYLYNSGSLDDYRYFFNNNILRLAANIFFNISNEYIYDIDSVNHWIEYFSLESDLNYLSQFSEKGNVDNIKKSYVKRNRNNISEKNFFDTDYFLVDSTIVNTVKKHCNSEISFDLYFPPVSILWYSNKSNEEFYYHFYMLRHIVDEVSFCRNVRVFAFGDELSLIGDMDNYRDAMHYRREINNYIAEKISSGVGVISKENISKYENSMLKNINEYFPYSSGKYDNKKDESSEDF